MADEKLAPLLGLTGRMGTGKSTVALSLVTPWWRWRQPVVRVRFAGALKAALHSMGLSEEHTDGALKEVPCDMLGGQTPRHAMQTLGTEWGRELITPDLWVRLALTRANKLRRQGIAVVMDDCRFPNEAEAVVAAGGMVISIVRADADEDAPILHASEQGVPPELITHTVVNDFDTGPTETINQVRRLWLGQA